MTMNVFSLFRLSRIRMAGVVSVAVLLGATSAYAGFEWVPVQPEPQPEVHKQAPVVEEAPSPVLPEPEEVLDEGPHGFESAADEPPPLPALGSAAGDRRAETRVVPPSGHDDEVVTFAEPPVQNVQTEATSSPVEQDSVEKPYVIMPEDAPETARQSLADKSSSPDSPLPAATEDVVHSDEATAIGAAPELDEQDVIGFGSDIPLALALQQVVPPGFAFSFSTDVNPGAKVSWTGGKPWCDVMHDMLAPLEMTAAIRGKVIFIHSLRHSAVRSQGEESLIEPSAGQSQDEEGDVSDAPAKNVDDISGMRRHNIQDPGFKPQEQNPETLAALDERVSQSVVDDRQPQRKEQLWEAESGDSLKQVLQSWSKIGDFEVDWQVLHDFTVQSDIMVAGNVDTALKVLVMNGLGDGTRPSVSFVQTQNPEQQRAVLIVQESAGQDASL